MQICIFSVLTTGSQGNTNVPADQTSNLRISNSGSLIINKVESNMKGSYTCKAENGFGEPLQKTIEIHVRGKFDESKGL